MKESNLIRIEHGDITLTDVGKLLAVSIVILLLISGGGIYWFVIRPYQAHKSCSNLAAKTEATYHDYSYQQYYDVCLNQKGL